MSAPTGPRVRRARRVGWAVAVLCATALPFALRVPVDNRMELWVDADGPLASDYARFLERFGSDEFLLVAYAGPDLLGEASLRAQLRVLDGLLAVPGVVDVEGPPALHRDLFAERDREALRRELLDTPFYRGFLVGDEGSMLGLYVETRPDASPDARRELVAGVEAALAPLRERGAEVYVVGPPVLNAALDGLSRREAARTFPFAFGLGGLVLLAAFRSWRPAAVAVACAGLAVGAPSASWAWRASPWT